MDPALGDTARRNLTVLMVRLKTLITVIAACEGALAMAAKLLHELAHPTWPARVPAGLCVAAVVGVFGWLVRSVLVASAAAAGGRRSKEMTSR